LGLYLYELWREVFLFLFSSIRGVRKYKKIDDSPTYKFGRSEPRPRLDCDAHGWVESRRSGIHVITVKIKEASPQITFACWKRQENLTSYSHFDSQSDMNDKESKSHALLHKKPGTISDAIPLTLPFNQIFLRDANKA